MTTPRDCTNRQDLIEALALAVDALHPAAVRTIVEYISNPLTDHDLADFISSLRKGADADRWPQTMTRPAQARLFDRINHAKTRYATFLRARNQHDVRVKWPHEHSLHSFAMIHSKKLQDFIEAIWTRRYTQRAAGNLGPQSYRTFSVILNCSDFARLCDLTRDCRIDVTENVVQTFGPLEGDTTPRTMEEIHLKMVETLHDIHKARFDCASPTIVRGNEPWFPYPNIVRQTNELVAPVRLENMMGSHLDVIRSWDSGHPADITKKDLVPSRKKHHHAVARRTHSRQRGKSQPRAQDSDHEKCNGLSSGKVADTSARGAVEEHGRYDKATRRAPPKDYQMEALSPSEEGSGSVAIASLSTVTGELRRMKSFVKKPSRGEALQPTLTGQEVEVTQAEVPLTPPSPSLAIPMSGRPPRNTGLVTPPDSASPVNVEGAQGPNKRFNRRVPSAHSKTRARIPSKRQSRSNKTDTSSTTNTTPRTSSSSSMESLNKASGKSSSTTAIECVDTPPRTILFSEPFEKLEPSERRRSSSGLGAFSPTKQATISVQHVDVIAQRSSSDIHVVVPAVPEKTQYKQADDASSPKVRTERIDSTISPTAVEALRDSTRPT